MTRPASTLALETHVLVVNEFTDTDAGVDAVVVEEEGAAKEAALAVAWVNSEEERGEERVEVLLRVWFKAREVNDLCVLDLERVVLVVDATRLVNVLNIVLYVLVHV